jgi:hypothetical protein
MLWVFATFHAPEDLLLREAIGIFAFIAVIVAIGTGLLLNVL